MSFFLDFQLTKVLGVQAYLVTNLALFLISLFLFRSLTQIFFKRETSPLLMAFFLVHPLFWRINTQVISRKYLLATVFALAALYFFKKIEQTKHPLLNYSLSFLMFICSLGSHPLLLAVPILLLLDNYTKTKKVLPENKGLIAYILLMVVVTLPWIYVYHQHATQVFQQYLGFSQISLNVNVFDQLLALGRYFIQLVLPISFAEFYYKWSWLNFLGVALLPLFIFGVIKTLPYPVVRYYSVWIIIGIFLPLISIESLFIRDGYFFFSSMGFIALLESLYQKFKSQQYLNNLVILMMIVLMSLSLKESRLLINRDLQVTAEYKREPSCQALIILLHHHLEMRQYEQLRELGPEMISRKCIWANRENWLTAQKLYLFVTAQTEKLQYEQKMGLIDKSIYQLSQFKTAKVMAAVVDRRYDEAISFMTELKLLHLEENNIEEDSFLIYVQKTIKDDCDELKSSSCAELDELIKNFRDRPSL